MMGAVEKKQKEAIGQGLINLVFSWSIGDVMNKDLYKNKVCLPLLLHFELHHSGKTDCNVSGTISCPRWQENNN